MSGIKNPMHGKENWNKGMTKDTHKSLKTISEKNSIKQKENHKKGILDSRGEKNGMHGKESWCKGIKKEDNIKILKAAEKCSIVMKEKWNLLSEEEKIIKIGFLSKISGFSRKNTLPERITSEILSEFKIEFFKDHNINKFIFDFYIEKYNLVIEVQGDYWHANPKKYENKELDKIQIRNIERDKRKEKYLIENKINHLFIWEFDLKNNKSFVIELIKNKINEIQSG
jgi:G:T-mismatch repair DNA endonuclease (very short patch repair protein)